MNNKENKRTGIDYHNTAGWKLMEHEENLKRMLNKGRKGRRGHNGNRSSEYED